ncbi:ribonucleotide-diphosphate reductase subunit beta [Haliovirga abyssi]|uniref:Ribonucleoside-diphosphate reductase subunit beta n=1 Tax=Haliovirga abyssi TaxID=2996794 RepID=A0AAU9DCH6_9FUSO|nr:ribonucleotide-diphosphate reductase subunit beta [Haliovirga abyssi]BDU49853.1 ribonucleoside-diphosphate reductase subunit beta [Haliovirga abyssi]
MKRKKLFNPDGNDNLTERSIIKGNSTNLFNLNNTKYTWATKLYRVMMENFWIPEKVDLTIDGQDYKKLTAPEKKAYDGILSFLVFLDSIQTNNVPKVAEYITAPEITLILSIQTYQEAIHSQSYAYIIESIVPQENRDDIYEFWRDNEVLFNRISFIAEIYQEFHDNPNETTFFKALIADYLLEAVYFYNGFNFFYLLTSRNLMPGTADIIRYINRDELTHVVIFENMIKALKDEFPNIIDEKTVYDMFEMAAKQEIEWTNHIIGNEVLGITKKSTEEYTKYMVNFRLKSLGFKPLYDGYDKNPYAHLEKIADSEGNGDVKANFFESTVTSYNMSSVIEGWDDI